MKDKLVLGLTMILLAGPAAAIELSPMPAENATTIAPALLELVGKVEKLPAKFAGDADNAKGLLSDDQQQALMFIPAKSLKDDRENPSLGEGKGMPIGYIFFHNLLPGDLKDKKKLFTFEYTDENGQKREVRFGVVTVKKESDDDFRMQIWGVTPEPVAEGNFEEEEGETKNPIELDYNGMELEVLLLGRYPSYITLQSVNF